MDKEKNLITEQVHTYILAGLGISTFSLALLPYIFDFTYLNQVQISIIISVSFLVSIFSFIFDKKYPKYTDAIAGYEFIFYSVSIGLVIHYVSLLNGPLIFIYGLVILSSAYFLSATYLNYIAGITSLFVVAEYLLLMKDETIEVTFVGFTYVLLRILYLVLLASAGRNLSVSISTQKKQLNQILKMNKQLGELQRVKGDFLDLSSHQLKTPLTAVKGNVSMILDGDFGEVSKNLLKPIKEVEMGTDRLSDVINNVVDTLKYEGNIQVKINPVLSDYKKLIQQETESFQPDAWVNNVKLESKIKDNIPNTFLDKEKIKIVISVLLDNAIKHCPRGGKTGIFVELKGDHIQTKITDNGPQLVEKDAKKIFSKLSSFSEDKNNELRESLGLSFYVAKKIIESHGGNVFFERAEGGENVFGFQIPIVRIEKKNRNIIKMPHV